MRPLDVEGHFDTDAHRYDCFPCYAKAKGWACQSCRDTYPGKAGRVDVPGVACLICGMHDA